MEFNNLHADISFSCLENEMDENLEYFFARKLRSSNVSDDDFLSHWELGKKPEKNTPLQICSYKGVSINKYNNESDIISKYRTLFKRTKSLAPKKGKAKYFGVFKFKSGAGLVFNDGKIPPFHCSFYKCDSFNVSKINLLQVKEF